MKSNAISDLSIFEKIVEILTKKNYEVTNKNDREKYHKEIGYKYPNVSRAEYALTQESFNRAYVRGYKVSIHTSFNIKTNSFAPKRSCGISVLVVNYEGKLVMNHKIRRSFNFVERLKVEIELVDYLLCHVPLDKWGIRMKLHRTGNNLTVWHTKMMRKKYIIPLIQILPLDGSWWVKPAKIWLKSKEYYETKCRYELGVKSSISKKKNGRVKNKKAL